MSAGDDVYGQPLHLILAVSVTLAACSDDDSCPSGTRVEGRCTTAVPDAGADAGGRLTDAGQDASADASGGEGEGEGECDPACEGATPRCDLDRLECVACLGDDDCAYPTPRCDPGGHTCVRCVEAADCSGEPGRPECLFLAHDCVQCRDDRDCAPISPAPRCDAGAHACVPCEPGGPECAGVGACFADGPTAGDDALAATGSCVGCNEDAECEAGDACDPWAHECVVARGNVAWCGACFADGDCEAGDACVVSRWPGADGVVVGTFCARDCTDPAGYPDADSLCAGEVGRGRACLATVARDGRAVSACLPATSTCDGFGDAVARTGCTTAEDCGADAADDGLCVAGEDTCTIGCESVDDCPDGFGACDGVPLHCL